MMLDVYAFKNGPELRDTYSAFNEVLKTQGINRGIEISSVINFKGLPEDQQLSLLNDVSRDVGIFTEQIQCAIKTEAEIRAVKKALKYVGAQPLCGQLFNHVAPDDVVEIYDHQGKQLWASLGFYKMCKYPNDYLKTYKWNDLWDKPQKAMDEIGQIIYGVLSGQTSQTVGISMPMFLQKEKLQYCGDALRTYRIQAKAVSPIEFTDGRRGFASVITSEVVAKGEDSDKFGIL